jgi:predicted AAA+ superfamily ATPase
MDSIKRLMQDPGTSFLLFGPRGTGKSTWLRQRFGDDAQTVWIDLLDPATFRRYQAQPERLQDLLKAHPDCRTVIIDEVQKIPELLGLVHRLIEADSRRRFVLTGSSSRRLRRGGVDLLAGRALPRTCYPFLAAELGDGFQLERALRIGMVPLIWVSDPVLTMERLQAYVALYIREEVQAEGLVRNLAAYARFLEAISFSQGDQLNLAEIGRECGIDRKLVESYLAVLEDILLAFRIPCFSKRAKRLLVNHEKFYFFDCGIFRALRPAGPLDQGPELEGAALEGLVAQHLRAWLGYAGETGGLHFWRTKGGLEVDFVVYAANCFLAIEVKNSTHVSGKDLRGLREFVTDYPEAQAVMLYRGTERIVEQGILCLPVADFLRALIPGTHPLTAFKTQD